jgi:hypothetical protein
MTDLKFAWRQLLKNPGFTTVAVLTLALGIGANTAIFSLINEQMLRPLPVKDASAWQAVVLMNDRGEYADQPIPYPIYQDYREQCRSFSELVGYASIYRIVRYEKAEGFASTQLVSPNYFRALGADPILGRGFSAEDEPVAVLGHDYWRRRFGADPTVIGKTVTIKSAFSGDLACSIVGIAPPGFQGLDRRPIDCWLPAATQRYFKDEMPVDFRLAGRLGVGVSRRQAPGGTRSVGAIPVPRRSSRGDVDLMECGRIRAAHRLRQRNQSVAGPCHQATKRNRGPIDAGRRPVEDHSTAVVGKSAAGLHRRRSRNIGGQMGG